MAPYTTSRRPSSRQTSHRRRRGVVLLVILSLLVLFALLGVTFAIVAGQYRKSSASFARRDQVGDEPSRQLDSAFYILLRDTPNSRNPLRGHALLSDVYGFNYLKGNLYSNGSMIAGGQFMEFSVTATAMPTQAGYFNGCVLTFTSGKLRGVSTRIVGYANTSGTVGTFRVMRPKMDDASMEQVTPTYAASGDNVLINGRAFSGTGAGFDSTTGKLNKTGTGYVSGLAALQPNRIGEMNAEFGTNYAAGDLNESYDACDPNNMFMAAVIPDPTNAAGHGVKIGANGQPQIIPSFHRPALLRYARANGLSVARVTMRPVSQLDDPTGYTAGPNFPIINLETGPWDVDNDGDGVADSIWADLDFPMITSASGRAYKPLFAIHCIDMDGKLNLNYHGNFQQDTTTATAIVDAQLAGAQSTATLARGVGLGPGEVNLMTGLGLTPTEFQQLMKGLSPHNGRYGSDQLPGNGNAPGFLDDATSPDPLAYARFFEYPRNYAGFTTSSFMSPPDLQGQLVFGVDHRGQLQSSEQSQVPASLPTPADFRLNTIYRLRRPYDEPFTPAEFERILRPYDIDAAALPRRLEQLTNAFANGNNQAAVNRRNVTVESRDIPVATAGPTYTTGGTTTLIRDPLTLLRLKMPSIKDEHLVKLVDPMLFHGIKMDLNRPLGNGVEPTNGNQQNQVIDEPSDNELNDQMSRGFDFVNGLEDTNGDLDTYNDIEEQRLVRYQLAKHLYVLASAVVETNSAATAPERIATQFALAQWAINVVDFRDSDSIMTPFEFDIYPFQNDDSDPNDNPWDVNGLLGNNEGAYRGVVWGCERPELLLSETLATHDRRTADTADEGPDIRTDSDGAVSTKMKGLYHTTDMADPNKDEMFDQKFLPEGSGFIEIYNPWASNVQRPPAEFYYDYQNATPQWTAGVRLNAVSPAGNSPVWRLLVIKGTDKGLDPDDPLPTAPQIPQADKERTVYFVDPSTSASPIDDDQGKRYFTTLPVAPLLPGRYAVVGSAGTTPNANGEYVTFMGFPTGGDPATYDQTILDEARRILLKPNADPNAAGQFSVLKNGATRVEPNYGTETQNVIAVGLNKALTSAGAPEDRRFSFSEPVDGYTIPGTNPQGTPIAISGLIPIEPPIDQPLDQARADEKEILMKKGTTPEYRVIHLQRLANPLAPFHKDTNPYRTIDTIGADITCFNGVEGAEEDFLDNAPHETGFETLQRGDHAPQPPTLLRSLWKRTRNQVLPIEPVENDATHYWKYKLQHTLGYMNSSYGDIVKTANGQYIPGDPDPTPGTTFPLLMWNNRPYNNVFELTNVPSTHSSMLTATFNVSSGTIVPSYGNSIDVAGYSHLTNYYYSPQTPLPAANPAGSVNFGHLYRIFDYLRVPNKFVESDTYFPASFLNAAGADYFRPPFNRYSNFRDPGMINVNTIYSPQTWQAILNGASGPTFDKLIASRRGYGGASNDILLSDPQYPTEFVNPVRASGAGKLAPLANMERSDIECTLLRSDRDTIDPPPATPNALFANTEQLAYNDVNRHAAMRHATLGRLSNTLTTRSNVYAVWITVGYFEVDPTNGQLGQEVGADSGEIRRHRAFYIVDRSIPVAFEPGENHNVDRAVLLRRFIE